MDWKSELIKNLDQLVEIPVHDRLRAILPTLSRIGMFSHLRDHHADNLNLYADILRFLGFHSHPSAFGLGLASMVQANLPGNILKLGRRDEEMNRLISGESIFSFAVSERGWKGRLSNTITRITKQEDIFVLNGEKGFATNGRNADFFLIVCAYNPAGDSIDERIYKVAILPKDTQGMEILPFDLEESQEATHAVLKLENVLVPKESLLEINYKEHARYLPHWERFCFHFLLLGLGDSMESDLSLQTFWECEKNFQDEFRYEKTMMEKMIYKKLGEVASSDISIVRIKDAILGQNFLKLILTKHQLKDTFPELNLFAKMMGL